MKLVPSVPRQIFVANPLLGWRLSANKQLKIRFRPDIIHTTGWDGWRSVTGQSSSPKSVVGFYGCSFTYGTALDDRETFTSFIQNKFPDTRIVNRGVGGYGTVQSYLQFREDVRNNHVDAAVFCVIGDHKYRNMPHPLRMKAFQSPIWYRIGVEHVPCAVSKNEGGATIRYVPIWQPALTQSDINVFLPDEIMLNHLTMEVIKEIRAFAVDTNTPFSLVLLDDMDDVFNRKLLNTFDNAIDISTPHDPEHRFLPDDPHPNVNAAKLYANRLKPIVSDLLKEVGAR